MPNSRRLKLQRRIKSSYDPPLIATFLALVAFVTFFLAINAAMVTTWIKPWLGQSGYSLARWQVGALFLLVSLVCGISAPLITEIAKKGRQTLRDSDLATDGPVCLFLRTFHSDRNVRVPNPFYYSFSHGASTEDYDVGPEEFVAGVLESHLIVRAVGGGETIGTTRVHTGNQHWQEIVKSECQNATLLVILPVMGVSGDQIIGTATLWELSYLAESGELAKTLVLMPEGRYHEGWEETRSRASQFKVDLPPYDQRGGVLLFGPDKGRWIVAKTYGVAGSRRKRLARGLLDGVQDLCCQSGVELLDR